MTGRTDVPIGRAERSKVEARLRSVHSGFVMASQIASGVGVMNTR